MTTPSIPQPLSQSDLFPLIKKLASQGKIKQTSHAQQRINQSDRNMSTKRINWMLNHPKQIINTEWDIKHKNYTYCIQCYNNRHCVIALGHDKIILITAY